MSYIPTKTNQIYLASASPRRRELLDQIGVTYTVMPVDLDESIRPAEQAEVYVQRLALAKARAVWSGLDIIGRRPVLAADTAVVVQGEILGKPRDKADALRMLAMLSGQTHEVLTAIALITNSEQVRLSRNLVSFRILSVQECEAYWQTGEPRDKAGAYAIQGKGAVFVSHLEGSYSGVMGLPLFETAELLRQSDVDVFTI